MISMHTHQVQMCPSVGHISHTALNLPLYLQVGVVGRVFTNRGGGGWGGGSRPSYESFVIIC
jgi:hypothetical protein